MANNAIEQLLSSEVLSEEVRSTLSEAWEERLTEAREEITAELREEFANRYETDKTSMVEALDAMVSDTINTELKEFFVKQEQDILNPVLEKIRYVKECIKQNKEPK